MIYRKNEDPNSIEARTRERLIRHSRRGLIRERLQRPRQVGSEVVGNEFESSDNVKRESKKNRFAMHLSSNSVPLVSGKSLYVLGWKRFLSCITSMN